MAALTAPIVAYAQPGERLDQMTHRVLGRTSAAVEEVLVANPNLADLGSLGDPLPVGQRVVFPVAAGRSPEQPLVQLWSAA